MKIKQHVLIRVLLFFAFSIPVVLVANDNKRTILEKAKFAQENIGYTYKSGVVEEGNTLIYSEGFEDVFEVESFDVDGNGECWFITADLSYEGDMCAVVKWNSDGNNDWLPTPVITLTGSGTMKISFMARSFDPEFPESFNVKLCPASTAESLSDFSVTLGQEVDIPATWTKYEYDISAYAGKSVIFAIQCVSVDKYYLCLDNINVYAEESTTVIDDWSAPYSTLYSFSGADLVFRAGDIDNLCFGWPANFDPFSGASTPSHSWPFNTEADDPAGTDRVMIGSGYTGHPSFGSDGYTSYAAAVQPVELTFDLKSITISTVTLQLFVDDFQAPVWKASYQVTIDGVRIPEIEQVINQLTQTGPIGKLITIQLPAAYNYLFNDGSAGLLIDDPTTGAGDGYAIDFVRVLINQGTYTNTASVSGTVKNSSGVGLAGVSVVAAGYASATSGSNGSYTINNAPAGIISVVASKSGYESVSKLVDVVQGNSTVCDFQLQLAGVEPDFSANKTSGTAPLTVNFTDQSVGEVTSWKWDFNNDGVVDATGQNPVYTYTNAGNYTVSLTVSNGTNSATETKSSYIQVTAPQGGNDSGNNDSANNANLITNNSSVNGSLGYQSDYEDWFSVTIPSDGELRFTADPSSELDLILSLYDVNGTTYIRGCETCGGAGSNDELIYENLKAGTYYIVVGLYYGQGTYVLSTSYTAAEFTNDTELNDSFDAALNLGPNSSTQGHIGYYSASSTDYYDWYKVTIANDGSLKFTCTPDQTLDISLSIYDTDGTTVIAGCIVCGASGENDEAVYENLAAGTYYLRLYNYYGWGSYTLESEFEAAEYANDSELNDEYETALSLTLGNTVTGHIGYYTTGYYDYYDWYVIHTDYDGELIVTGIPDATLDLSLALYDLGGTNYFSGCETCGGANEQETAVYKNLAAGTYYIRCYRYYGHGSYQLKAELVPTTLYNENDSESNDDYLNAISISANNDYPGHLGYYSDSKTDLYDWYKFSILAPSNVEINVHPYDALDVSLSLFDGDGTSYLSGCTTCGGAAENDQLLLSNVEAGDYYLRLYDYFGYGSYTLNYVAEPVSENKVDALDKQKPVKVYNDVANGVCRIEIAENVSLKGLILYSNKGQKVKEFSPIKVERELELDISDCSIGLYILWIRTEDNTYRFKIALE